MTLKTRNRLLGCDGPLPSQPSRILLPAIVALGLLSSAPLSHSQAVAPLPQAQSPSRKDTSQEKDTAIAGLSTNRQNHEDWTTLSIRGLGLNSSPPVILATADSPQFRRELVRLRWRANDPVDLYISLPKGVRKPRVVLYLYGFPSDSSRFTADDWCNGATQGGFAAVGFVSALTGERYRAPRPLKQWFVSELQESLATTTHDVQMVLDYLETRDDLNMDRVAMYAQGSGATIAILAASVDPRITVLDLLNPWGDWPNWLKQTAWLPEDERPSYLRPEFLEKISAFDPVQVLPKLTKQVVRLQQVKDERLMPKSAKERIASALPRGATFFESDSWAAYSKAWTARNLWNWAKEQLEPASSFPPGQRGGS